MTPKLYAYAAALVVLLAGLGFSHWKAYDSGKAAGMEKWESQKVALAEARVAALEEEVRYSRTANAELVEKLANMPRSTSVKEIIHANPSACVVPEPVARGLQELARDLDSARSAK